MKTINILSILAVLFFLPFITLNSEASEKTDGFFDVKDVGEPSGDVPLVKPWKTITLDKYYGGLWIAAGDVDGDGAADIVSAENVNQGDVHYTSTAVAQRLDGSVIWRWGDHKAGRKIWHHDVACQIHDWDGDGANEVILCAKDHIVELDGKTGLEKRRFPIEKEASDCLVFCDLSGKGRPTDVLVKNRYHQIWAYNYNGELLWTIENPGGYRTAHQPRPIDLDGDGRDEIMAGYAMLNSDGGVRWVYKSKAVDQKRGHLDCVRVVKHAKKLQDVRLVLTCCGANNLAMIDGNGKVIWEESGHHFESITVGRIDPKQPGKQILVDIDHTPIGQAPMWVLDENGRQMGQIVSDYCRHHRLIDWTGDGFCEIFVAHNRAVYNYRGKRIATLQAPKNNTKGEDSLLPADMDGDGVQDILLATPEAVYIYKNTDGKRMSGQVPLGTGLNVTLY